MTTTYIDLNAQNAKIINTGKNNRFNVQMNNGMRLPTGTQVSVQNSFINYQGVVGASIEIREQIVEEIAFGYYKSDTFEEEPYITDSRTTGVYQYVSTTPGGPTDAEKGLFFDMGQVAGNGFQPILKNARLEVNPNLIVPQQYQTTLENAFAQGVQIGNTETCLPVGTPVKVEIGDFAPISGTVLIPSTFRARIQIDPGVYSVEELASNITDQINGAKIASQNNKSSREIWNEDLNLEALDPATNLFTNTYCHCPPRLDDYVTDPTNGPLIQGFNGAFDAFAQIADEATRTQNLKTIYGSWFTDVGDVTRPGNVTEDNFMEAGNYNTLGVGVQQSLMAKAFDLVKNVPEADWTPAIEEFEQLRLENFLASSSVTPYSAYASLTTPQNNILPTTYKITKPAGVTGNNAANIGNTKFMIGTTRFKMAYDSPSSLYTVSGAHQDRKQPSHDMFSNTMPSPGQTSIFQKTIRDAITPLGGDFKIFAKIFNKYMTRLGGIYIYNWAVKTAKQERNNDNSGANPYSEDYFRFDEFFTSQQDARLAWDKTLWARLGFTYDQLQNPENWTNHQPVTGESSTFLGFTTDMEIDSSIASSISSTYGGPRTVQLKVGDALPNLPKVISEITQPAINQVSTFNLLGINVPSLTASATNKIYNVEQLTQRDADVKTDTYQSGFYTDAVMRPIVTAEVPVKAVLLPRLNNSGYFLITSDSLQNTDSISKMSPSCILDVVPISSLASTDFISNRNEMVHTITNEKVLNTIDINIIYPDGTDPTLQPNSAVLLKIVTPLPPITNILAQGQAQEQLAAIEAQAQQSQQKQKKK